MQFYNLSYRLGVGDIHKNCKFAIREYIQRWITDYCGGLAQVASGRIARLILM